MTRGSEGAYRAHIPIETPERRAHLSGHFRGKQTRMGQTLSGLASSPGALFDERGRPDFRDVFGALASSSIDVATAVTHVRLSTVDLGADELAGVEHFRVLVAELSAIRLDREARAIQADPRRAPRAELLRSMLESGRLEVRSAPLAGWSPDFTVFSDRNGPTAVLAGYHWFQRPYPHRGPAISTLHEGDAARLAARRHQELWERAHDVSPAVWNILSKAHRAAQSAALQAG
jgi:hypothetical protein